MTGRDPRRFGYEGNLNKTAERYATRPELLGLPLNEHTLADHLAAADYDTALIGKWHLGSSESFHPNRRGFRHFCGMLGGGHTYFPTPDENKIECNGKPVSDFSSPYLTDFFTDVAIRFIDDHSKAADQPWLMVLSYNAPHTPMQALNEDLEKCKHISDSKRRTYVAMVQALDRGVGRVSQRLRELNQWENTLIVFLSDNGGPTGNASWNGELSGSKGTLREGGIRVPMIWSWPNELPKGRTCRSVVTSLDILTTFLSAAGANPLEPLPLLDHQDKKNSQRLNKDYGHFDGVDLLPTLAGKADSKRKLHWRLQGQAAILDGDYKLIRLNHRPAQLFKPGTDPAERRDLSGEELKTVNRMFRALAEWESSLTTVPLWDSSPFWWGDSARKYDSIKPTPEP